MRHKKKQAKALLENLEDAPWVVMDLLNLERIMIREIEGDGLCRYVVGEGRGWLKHIYRSKCRVVRRERKYISLAREGNHETSLVQ